MRITLLGASAALFVLCIAGCSKTENGSTNVLDGNWAVVAITADGERGGVCASRDQIKGMTWSINDGQIIGTNPDGSTGKMSFRLESEKALKTIDITATDGNCKGETARGIYALGQKRLLICLPTKNADRPTELTAGLQSWTMELERVER
jgi:uncharacterized protein (TIGR03067 family)